MQNNKQSGIALMDLMLVLAIILAIIAVVFDGYMTIQKIKVNNAIIQMSKPTNER